MLTRGKFLIGSPAPGEHPSVSVTLWDLLSMPDVAGLILEKLRADDQARLGSVNKRGKQLVEHDVVTEHLRLSNCLKVDVFVLRTLVQRAINRGTAFKTVDITGCQQLREGWKQVEAILVGLGRLRDLRMEGGPLVYLDAHTVAGLVRRLSFVAESVSFDVRGLPRPHESVSFDVIGLPRPHDAARYPSFK